MPNSSNLGHWINKIVNLIDVIILFAGYASAAFFLLIAAVFFGWSRILRAIFVIFALGSILLQHGCNRLTIGIGRATGGEVTPGRLGDHVGLIITILLTGTIILLLVLPNWGEDRFN